MCNSAGGAGEFLEKGTLELCLRCHSHLTLWGGEMGGHPSRGTPAGSLGRGAWCVWEPPRLAEDVCRAGEEGGWRAGVKGLCTRLGTLPLNVTGRSDSLGLRPVAV